MSDDYIFEHFLESIKKEKSDSKGVSITPVNFELFKVDVKGDGIMDLKNLAILYEWSKSILKQSAHHLEFIIRYHHDSPRYWLKNATEISKDGEEMYSVAIDLESFLDSKKKTSQKTEKLDFYIPDNYELAKKVLKEFRKDVKNKKFKFFDTSFRELAVWDTKDLKAAQALGDFINKQYVQPGLKIMLDSYKISKVIFVDNRMDFEYYE